MPQFHIPLGSIEHARQFSTLDAFTRGYIEAAFFTDTGNAEDEDLQDATFADLAPETLASMVDDCARFQEEQGELLARAYERGGYSEERAGHDFWLTRNGHGAGFWDRKELEAESLGRALSDACGWRTSFPEVNLYAGDDKRVYS